MACQKPQASPKGMGIYTMERYDYLKAVTHDVKVWLYTHPEYLERDEEEIHDALWSTDSVTGNASGSYFCSAWSAEEALCHNFELLAEALTEFGCDISYLAKGAEACDVTIRCYLLSQVIPEAIAQVCEEIKLDDDSCAE